jgi:uncharacterized membrane protein YfhO
MLKIKDNVDLKKLEKFGFEKNSDDEYQLTMKNHDVRTIIVVEDERTIYLQAMGYVVQDIDILYDLIKADLVEKI